MKKPYTLKRKTYHSLTQLHEELTAAKVKITTWNGYEIITATTRYSLYQGEITQNKKT